MINEDIVHSIMRIIVLYLETTKYKPFINICIGLIYKKPKPHNFVSHALSSNLDIWLLLESLLSNVSTESVPEDIINSVFYYLPKNIY